MAKRVGYFEYAPGHKSMGRLLAFMMTAGGVFCVVAGVLMAVADWIWNAGASTGTWIGLALGGLGSEIGGTAMKNWAKSVEAKQTEVQSESIQEVSQSSG